MTEAAEYNLRDQREAMAVLAKARESLKLDYKTIKDRATIANNSAAAWLTLRRSPVLRKFICLLDALGYSLVMKAGDVEFDLKDQRAAMLAIDEERRRRGMSLGDMEDKSGVSISSVYAWRSGERSPNLCNMIAIAETFGFSIVMRFKGHELDS